MNLSSVLLHLRLGTTLQWLFGASLVLLFVLRYGRNLSWVRSSAIAWTAFMFAGLSTPSSGVPHVGNNDKIIHALIFIGFGYLWRRSGLTNRQTVIWGAVFAVLTEIYQALMPIGRSGDWEDAFADLVGVLIGLLFARITGLLFRGQKQ